MTDLTGANWRKSSRSAEGNCVEVADNLLGLVAVRDSKDPDGPALTFVPARWTDFVHAVRSGGHSNVASARP
ncbi:DUF397 domain-containing protein [Micromonospora zhanjiangensis]|uniref:DUF397 domain-containing protein n=1 Tax=Micromonospora zhanjiangensis TaxID=1522057 RepID=A0ABV8KHH7_9ACTN